MKLQTKRVVTALLLVFLLVPLLLPPVTAEAEPTGANQTSKRFNIMLVIDGSGSLVSHTTTDPMGMRYELINDLFGILEDDGHNVGAIVFSGNPGSSDADADMQKAIRTNTGMLSLNEPAPDGRLPKDYLLDEIVRAGVDNHQHGTTDIGTALLTAERELQAAQAENGMESLVFLFTDGCTSFIHRAPLATSMENLQTATYEMSQNGIRLMGAFLNKNGKLDATEIQNIICAANGISTNSSEFRESYVEITDAASCHMAVNTLLSFLGYVSDVDPEIVYGDLTDQFTIPGTGVEEMNIRLYSADGEDLADLQVSLTQPDGSQLQGDVLRSMCRSSRTFRVYKLSNPMPGQWTLNIHVPDDAEVRYYYSPVASVYVNAALETDPAPEFLYCNQEARFHAMLTQSDTPIVDVAGYNGYTCTLELTNKGNSEKETFTLTPDASGKLILPKTMDTYGSFSARTIFDCGGIRIESPAVDIDIVNEAPHIGTIPKQKLKYGLFQKGSSSLDVSQFYDDREDGKNVTVAVDGGTCNAEGYQLNGTVLELRHKKLGKGTISFRVTDTQGAESTFSMMIVPRSVTIWWLLGMLLVLILAGAAAFLIIRNKNAHIPDGVLTASFTCKTESGARDISLELPVPGANTVSKTTLDKLLMAGLREQSTPVAGVSGEDISEFLQGYTSDLSRVPVYSGIKTVSGKTRGAVVVKDGKRTNVLFNSACSILAGDGTNFDIEFVSELPEDDPFLDTEPMPSKKGKEKQELDDLFDF